MFYIEIVLFRHVNSWWPATPSCSKRPRTQSPCRQPSWSACWPAFIRCATAGRRRATATAEPDRRTAAAAPIMRQRRQPLRPAIRACRPQSADHREMATVPMAASRNAEQWDYRWRKRKKIDRERHTHTQETLCDQEFNYEQKRLEFLNNKTKGDNYELHRNNRKANAADDGQIMLIMLMQRTKLTENTFIQTNKHPHKADTNKRTFRRTDCNSLCADKKQTTKQTDLWWIFNY